MKNTGRKPNVDAVISWKLDVSGLLSIEGSGKIPDYSCGRNPAAPWEDKKEAITSVSVGEGITEIGINAFRDCTNLKKVVLPETIQRIHAYAFRNCTSLTDMESGKREWRYVYDRQQRNGDDVIIFGVETFLNVPWAERYWSNFYCNRDALYVCFSSGDKITVPEGICILKSFCFSNIRADKIILPETLEEIEDFAFSQASMSDILRIPDQVHKMSMFSFVDSRFCSFSFPPDWRSRKIPWEWERMKTTCRQRFPKWRGRYSVGQVKGENLGKFRRLKIIENKPIRHKNGQVTAIFDNKPVAVGDSMLQRIRTGRILICISYEENRVSSVKSFSWENEDKLVNEYLMYPVQKEDTRVGIWSDSFTWQEPNDIRYAFSSQDGETLSKAGVLRFQHPDTHEEWFWTEDDGNFGGPLELNFLKAWMKTHPEMVIDSAEENIEKSQYRWFVDI